MAGVESKPMVLDALEAKVAKAQPRDRCFLYAELVSRVTEVAVEQLRSGDSQQGQESLVRLQQYAEGIRLTFQAIAET
jgi:hypothetical protein